jgi:uncharacterized repeat protein (TIGR03803 family)
MRALISIAVAMAFLCCSSGMVNASPLSFLLAPPAMKPAVSVPLLSRLPFLQQPDVSKNAPDVVLHSFGAETDGAGPYAGLIYENGVFYGTTEDGGAYNEGSVFEITATGTESVLYSFSGGADGGVPFASLIDVNGIFYGTTSAGGANGDGTVFEVTAGGVESVLYSFAGTNKNDGANPQAGLVYANGNFYGTTTVGGHYNGGTVFEVTPGGTESVLHAFTGNPDNGLGGYDPQAGLVYANGNLYGTTAYGGNITAGTVFEVTGGGAWSILYSFHGGKDARYPYAGLVYANNVLYGTTASGGKDNEGAVFEITSSGTERVLHSFTGGVNGASPYAGLVYANGYLYGTTWSGGQYDNGNVFKMTANGTTSVIHTFESSKKDGARPYAGLAYANGLLYGTTYGGGQYGKGTVFDISP